MKVARRSIQNIAMIIALCVITLFIVQLFLMLSNIRYDDYYFVIRDEFLTFIIFLLVFSFFAITICIFLLIKQKMLYKSILIIRNILGIVIVFLLSLFSAFEIFTYFQFRPKSYNWNIALAVALIIPSVIELVSLFCGPTIEPQIKAKHKAAHLINVTEQKINLLKELKLSNILSEEQYEKSVNLLYNNRNEENKTMEENEKKIIKVKTVEDGMEEQSFKNCKIWLIIGTILTPAVVGSPIMKAGADTAAAIIALVMYGVGIPLCVFAIKALKKAKKREDLTVWGIICLIFISVIGGALILSSKFKTKEIEESEVRK